MLFCSKKGPSRIIGITRIGQKSKLLSRIFSDDSLTKKASLNALTSALDYGARLIVAFFVTPWMVAGLGDYYYGAWQILNRLVGYLAPTSGKPTQVLQSTIANQQASTDYELKRRYVGATLVIWMLFLPTMGITGGLITWFVPFWLHAPEKYIWTVRATTALLVANLVTTSLATLPESALEGENLSYQRIGLSVILVFIGGGLTWLALHLDTGIIGVAAVALTMTLLTGLLYLMVARTFIPWFGVARPSRNQIRHFLSLSWWFLSWNTLMNLMIASDVVLLGLLGSVESVTSYSLTKYAPETLISVVAIMFFGVIPGLGGIIGSGDLIKAASIRGEIMAITWLIVTVLGASILVWNRPFIELWVGKDYFVGALPNLLIVMVVTQFVFIRNDSNIIDVTLRLEGKVLISTISITLSLLAAGILIKYFDLGVVGLCVGILAGRSIISIGFPVLIGRFLKVPLISQIKGVLRPVSVTILVLLLATWGSTLVPCNAFFGLKGWILFILLAGLTSGFFLALAIFAGFSAYQRKKIAQRIRSLASKTSS
jgi:O-antigen/teichoic acid export membrane protein